MKTSLLVPILLLIAAAAFGADITGHHFTPITPADFIDDTVFRGDFWQPRVFYGEDTWLSARTHSYYLYTKGGLWRPSAGWRDLVNSEATFYFGCPGSGCAYEQWGPCDIPGDEVWAFTYDPAHIDSIALPNVPEGHNVPSWHSMHGIAPCPHDAGGNPIPDPDGLNAYSPSQPFIDGPNSDRLFLIIEQSDTAIFPRYLIQFVNDRASNARWFKRTQWKKLLELDRTLWRDAAQQPEIRLLHVVCPNDGDRVESGGNLQKITWQCLFHFLRRKPDGSDPVGFARPEVGVLRLEFDATKLPNDPYRVWIARNSATDLVLLPTIGGTRTLNFVPFALPAFFGNWPGNAYVPHQITTRPAGGQEVWMFYRPPNVTSNPALCPPSTTYTNNGGGRDGGLYVADYAVSGTGEPLIGTKTLLTKSAAGNPPGSTYLPVLADAWSERYTVSVANDRLFSTSKHDPHSDGLPYLCSHYVINPFVGMSITVEPLNSALH